jgi:hypothetical protein
MKLKGKITDIQPVIPHLRHQPHRIEKKRKEYTENDPDHDHNGIRCRMGTEWLSQYNLLDTPIPGNRRYDKQKEPNPPLAESLDLMENGDISIHSSASPDPTCMICPFEALRDFLDLF